MPLFNKTGPAGKGAKTGGQMGKCAGAKPRGRSFNGIGRGKGRGMSMQGRYGRRP